MRDYQQSLGRTDRTYTEDVENPIEIQLPVSNFLFVAPRVDESRGRISSSLLDDLSLNLGHSSMIQRSVSRSFVTVLAHVANCWIASSTD